MSTERFTALDVVEPTLFVTVTAKLVLSSAEVVAGVVYAALFAPAIAAPFFNHWNVNGAVPVAETEKVAVCPTVTAVLTGGTMIAGALGAGRMEGTGWIEYDAVPEIRPGAEAVTVTVPGVNWLKTAILVRPPSNCNWGSPGAW